MSIYRRKGSKFYQYDFWIANKRFRGSTGETTERKARRAESEIKAKARQKVDEIDKAGPEGPPLRRVFGYFWEHFGQHEKDTETTLYRMRKLMEGLGEETKPGNISDQLVSAYAVQRRSTPTVRNKLPAAATINRELEMLRRILRKTRKPLGFAMPDIEWKDVRAKEPRERVVELTHDEEVALFRAFRGDAQPLFIHYLMTGVRLSMAINLKKTDVYLNTNLVRFIGKGDKEIWLPITPELREVYVAEMAESGCDHVFTYEAQKTRGALGGARMTIKGKRYPYSVSQVRALWRRAVAKAVKECPSVSRLRIHDFRHTFATRFYRDTKDILATQKLLGHSDRRSTDRYAHSSPETERAALEAHHARPRVAENIVSLSPKLQEAKK